MKNACMSKLRRSLCQNNLDLKTASIPELKKIIRQAGLSFDDCFEKAELVKRATEARMAKNHKSAYLQSSSIIKGTRLWLQDMVINLKLCPFAESKKTDISVIKKGTVSDDLDIVTLDVTSKAIYQIEEFLSIDSTMTAKLLVFPDVAFSDISRFKYFLNVLSLRAQSENLCLHNNSFNALLPNCTNLGTTLKNGPVILIPYHPNFAKLTKDGKELPDSSVSNFVGRSPWPTIKLLKQSDRAEAEVQWLKKHGTRNFTNLLNQNEKTLARAGHVRLSSMLEKFSCKGEFEENPTDAKVIESMDKEHRSIQKCLLFYHINCSLQCRFC